MTDIKLLPLPEVPPFSAAGARKALQDWCRANVLHHTAAQAAEIEALRAEVAAWEGLHASEVQVRQRWQARAERLAEALRWYVENDDTNEGQEGNEYWLAGRDRAIAVLRDYDQEGKDG